MIDVFDVVERLKSWPISPASPDDFTTQPAGSASPSTIVDDPAVSLYCLDHDARRALFVQVPDGIDVTAAPFLYMAQYDHAERLLSVPYETFHRLASEIESMGRLVFIYTTGRAGSTLLSKAFAEMESTTSLSEPDPYTQAVAMRSAGVPDAELCALMRSATRFLFKPAITGGSALHVVKFRSFCIQIADLLARTFPDAGNLFLYRDVEANVRSYARAFGGDTRPPEEGRAAAAGLAATTPLLAEERRRRLDFDGIEIVSLLWLSAMHGYARCRREGIPIESVRYEELMGDPAGVLGRILSYLDLPVEDVQAGLRAFERDSQAGSPIARDVVADRQTTIDARQWEMVRALLERYPLIGADVPAESVAVPTVE